MWRTFFPQVFSLPPREGWRKEGRASEHSFFVRVFLFVSWKREEGRNMNASQWEEDQSMEIEALQSIYADDFKGELSDY